MPLIRRPLTEKPEANPGEPDERLVAGFARRFLQRECDRVVQLREQFDWNPAGDIDPADRGKTREQRFDRRSRGA